VINLKRKSERESDRREAFFYCVLWHGLWGKLLWCAWRGIWLCGSTQNHGCEQDCCALRQLFHLTWFGRMIMILIIHGHAILQVGARESYIKK